MIIRSCADGEGWESRLIFIDAREKVVRLDLGDVHRSEEYVSMAQGWRCAAVWRSLA